MDDVSGLFFDKAGQPITMRQFAELAGKEEYRVIGQDTVGDRFISTVWLGIDHDFWTDKLLIFETMVFDISGQERIASDVWDRYSTEEAAKDGHTLCVHQYATGVTGDWT